jgi:hypothetical protein
LVKLEPPEKTITPYGGRLTFNLPGGTSLLLHLKDKSKIRNKKRWSQVMYMYYLLGYKYFGDLETLEAYYNQTLYRKIQRNKNEFIGFGNLLNNIEEKLRKKVSHIFLFL